jgi:3D (Asp-Asp-Asp) domain-containing protein
MFVTGYDDVGRTATGTQARWGEVAVDPTVIPLGSWIEVQGIPRLLHAEDTGGLVRGYHIDVWLSTAAACYKITSWRMARWSRRKADLRTG